MCGGGGGQQQQQQQQQAQVEVYCFFIQKNSVPTFIQKKHGWQMKKREEFQILSPSTLEVPSVKVTKEIVETMVGRSMIG